MLVLASYNFPFGCAQAFPLSLDFYAISCKNLIKTGLEIGMPKSRVAGKKALRARSQKNRDVKSPAKSGSVKKSDVIKAVESVMAKRSLKT